MGERPFASLKGRLAGWFGLDAPVDRRTYFLTGAGLMMGKYAMDALVIGLATGRFWSPLDYLNPFLFLRSGAYLGGPSWLGWVMALWTLPFLWIGVTMTLRRSVDAGFGPWSCLLFFLPFLNYGTMIALSLAPSRPTVLWRGGVPAPPPQLDQRVKSAMIGIAAGLAVAVPTVLVSVYVLRTYSSGLFLGTPFSLGAISAFLYNKEHPRGLGDTLTVAVLSVAFLGGMLILFAAEGLLCILMAFPIAGGLAILGAILGRAIAIRSSDSTMHAAVVALLVPNAMSLMEARAPLLRSGQGFEVVSAIEIAAPPAAVWPNVIAFSEIPPPTERLFRAGVAYPIRARIEGAGVGAVRYCEFSTGAFVEPITAWDAPHRLAFGVREQPQPLREWSPFRQVRAPHLDGFFRSTAGEFRLVELAGGRTRLEASTWYELDIHPDAYWTLYADRIVHAIHMRVLRHIEKQTVAR